MADLVDLDVWDDQALRRRLEWYREVAANRMPAKALIARRIPAEVELDHADETELWRALERQTQPFLQLWARIRDGSRLPRRTAMGPSLVDLAAELTQRMLRHCNFCRWDCAVDRGEGTKTGTCQLAADSRVSSYFHHRGEEGVYQGTGGSGTIFFTSCNLRCAFCQNGDISTDKHNGVEMSARQLAAIARQLRLEGCHNVNWVGGDPTIHLHTIVGAIAILSDESFRPSSEDELHILDANSDRWGRYRTRPELACHGGMLNVPQLWNSNFFMSEPAMLVLRILMDVWLPDLKFGPGPCAVRLSRTPWYWETVTGNLLRIHSWGEDFTIRHLVMPGHVECCTMPILDWIAEHMPDAPVNVMDQYHPDNFCDPRGSKFQSKYADIARRPTADEIRKAFRHAQDLGLAFEALSYERNTTGLRA